MGILDNLFTDDPQQAAQLALAAGLLGGRGNLGGIMSRSLAGAQDVYAQSRDSAMKRKLIQAQIADMAQQEELRRQQARKIAEGEALLSRVLNKSGSPSQYGAGGTGLNLGGVTEPMTPQQGGLAGATDEEIAALKNYGTDLLANYKLAKFGEQVPAGQYLLGTTGKTRYLNKPDTGTTYDPNTNQMSIIPGAPESLGGIAGATTAAQEKAKSPYQLVDYVDAEGVPRKTTLDLFKGAQVPQQGNSLLNAILADMRKTKVDSADFNLGGIKGTLNLPSGPSSGPDQIGGIRAGFSPAEQAAAAGTRSTTEKLGTEHAVSIKDSYDSAIGAMSAVNTSDRLIKLLDKGKAYLGPGATIVQKAQQFAYVLGVGGSNTEESLSNTRAIVQSLAQSALDARAKLKGSGQISDYEQKVVQKAHAGDINEMTLPEIRVLANVNRDLGLRLIKMHESKLEQAKSNPTLSPFADMFSLPIDRSTSIRKFNPATGGLE